MVLKLVEEKIKVEYKKKQGSKPKEVPPVIENFEVLIDEEVAKELWDQLNRFRADPTTMEYAFPPSLSVSERRHIHHFADLQGLSHNSQGEGEYRCIIVSKLDTTTTDNVAYPYAQYQWKDNRKVGVSAPSITNNEILPYRSPKGPDGKNSKGFSAEYIRFRLTNL